MKFSSLIAVLISTTIAVASPISEQAESDNHTEFTRFSDSAIFNVAEFSQVYYRNLGRVTASDVEKLQRFISVVENDRIKSYHRLLLDLVKQNRLENFKLLFPMIELDEMSVYDIYLMLESVSRNMQFVEFMINQGFDSSRFIYGIKEEMQDWPRPGECIDLIEWVSQRNPAVAEHKFAIYSDFLWILLKNYLLDEVELFAVVRKMISIWVVATDSIVKAYEKEYPGNTIIEDLRNSQALDIKEPEE